ncbi:hypothetical protein Tco_0480350, partial [Tanacetum coccineum]
THKRVVLVVRVLRKAHPGPPFFLKPKSTAINPLINFCVVLDCQHGNPMWGCGVRDCEVFGALWRSNDGVIEIACGPTEDEMAKKVGFLLKDIAKLALDDAAGYFVCDGLTRRDKKTNIPLVRLLIQ